MTGATNNRIKCKTFCWHHLTSTKLRNRTAQGKDINDLPYRAKWFPFAPIISIVLCIVVILGQEYENIVKMNVSWVDLFATYISAILFLCIWLGYKIKYKTKIVDLKQCDFN
ncbi:hypothetical protein H9I32_28620 [Bacillus sp. Xin]|nr:hypothetical protein [Bacillus sp. Xin]